jgi:hypothetical protein
MRVDRSAHAIGSRVVLKGVEDIRGNRLFDFE